MELKVRQFRWHEQFHVIPWNLKCANFADTRSSMEFHGIPWNLECANFAETRSFMEFHGIPWNLECANFADTSSSMEFYGTRSVPISMTRAIPWNSMELWIWTKFHGIQWNSMEPQMLFKCCSKSSMELWRKFHGTFWPKSFNEHWKEILNDILLLNE